MRTANEKTSSTISVVDDDESVRKALKRVFRSMRLNVDTFASAEEFLESLGDRSPSRTPSCLVLDVRMPGMSGLELQEFLAAAERPIPIIFITAHEDNQARAQAFQAGAVGFLQKPFDHTLLLEAVTKALEPANGQRHRTP